MEGGVDNLVSELLTNPNQLNSSLSLLDLPSSSLEKILNFLAYDSNCNQNYNPPFGILQTSMTCKTLRELSAHVLTDDRLWVDVVEYSNFNHGEILSCPHVSEDISTPISSLRRGQCSNPYCSWIHNLVAWYRIASSGIQKFRFSDLCTIAPGREANQIIQCIARGRPELKELRIEKVPTYAVQRVKTLIYSLNDLLKVIANNLETLVLDLNTPDCSKIIDALCACSVPSLHSVQLDISTGNIDRNIHLAMRILWHALYSDAKIRELKFHTNSEDFGKIQKLSILCPHLYEFTLSQVRNHSFVDDINTAVTFKMQSLRLNGIYFTSAQLSCLIESVVRGQRPMEIHFEKCSLPSLGAEISKYGHEFGQKLKTLVLNDIIGMNTIRSMHSFCKELETCQIVFPAEAIGVISKFLAKANHLKTIDVGCIGEIEEDDVRKLLVGFKKSKSSFTSLTIRHILLKPKYLGLLISFLPDEIEKFDLNVVGNGNGNGTGYSLKAVKSILKKVKHQGTLHRFRRLRKLKLPLQNVTEPVNIDGELLILKVRKCLIELKTMFKYLDVREYALWVQKLSGSL